MAGHDPRRQLPPYMRPKPSSIHLRERMARHEDAMRQLQTEALYQAQLNWTCQMLDVVDEAVDHETAVRITDRIYEALSGDGASEAAARARQARREIIQQMYAPPQPMFQPPGATP